MKIYWSFLLSAATLSALPQSAPIGDAIVEQNGSSMRVETNDCKAVLQWNDFSIASGESIHFAQPCADAAVLNRVVGGSLSEIHGVLSSNGQVWLVNPAGIFMGPNAVIDTAGFLAAAFDVLTEDFLAQNQVEFRGESGKITHLGKIYSPYGTVHLLAKEVDNRGIVDAANMAIAAGPKFLLAREEAKEAFIQVDPNFEAETPHAHAIRMGGETHLKEGGKLLLYSHGDLSVEGKIEGAELKADVFGDRILIEPTARLELPMSKVRIGGTDKGLDRSVPHAEWSWVKEGAFVDISGREDRSGGNLVLWGEKAVQFLGEIDGRSGALGGKGGNVEVSSLGHFLCEGPIDLRGVAGTGTLLWDPVDVTITAAGNSAGVNLTTTPVTLPVATTANINLTQLQNRLGVANVEINATGATGTGVGNVTASVDINWVATNDLTIIGNIITFNNSLSGGGDISLTGTDVIFLNPFEAMGNLTITCTNLSANLASISGADVTITTDTYDAVNVVVTGTLIIRPLTIGRSMGIQAVTGGLDISSSQVSSILVGGLTEVHLGSATTGDISFNQMGESLGFSSPLTLESAGEISFLAGGAIQADGGLDIIASSISLNGIITSAPGVSAAMIPITLEGNSNINNENTAGNISLGDIDGMFDLTIGAGTATVIIGDMGTGTPLANVIINGSNILTTGSISASSFSEGAVTATLGSLDIGAGGIGFFSTTLEVDDVILTGGSLSSTNTGVTTFHGAVTITDGTLILTNSDQTIFEDAVSISGMGMGFSQGVGTPGALQFGSSVSAENGIEIYGPVELIGNCTMTSSAGSIAINNTINGAFNFTCNAATTIALSQIIGGVTPVGSFSLAGSATSVTLSNDVTAASINFNIPSAFLAASVQLTTSGVAGMTILAGTISGPLLTAATPGPISLTTDVLAVNSLTGANTFTLAPLTASTNIGFDDIDSPIIITSSLLSGASFTSVVVGSSMGSGTITVGDPFVSPVPIPSPTTLLSPMGTIILQGGLSTSGGSSDLLLEASVIEFQMGNSVATAGGDLTFDGEVSFIADATIGTMGGDIVFTEIVDGARDVTLVAGAGDVVFTGNVGGMNPLTNLVFTSAAEIQVGANIAVSGANDLTFPSPVLVVGTSAITNVNNTITFGSTINGAESLSIDAGMGNVVFSGNVGGMNPLTNLVFTSAAEIQVGANIAVSGANDLTFSSPVLIQGTSAITNVDNTITFGSTINGAESLSIDAGMGSVNFNGEVGGMTPLESLEVTASSIFISANITTDGNTQEYFGPVMLHMDTVFSELGGDILFHDTISGVMGIPHTVSMSIMGGGVVADGTINVNALIVSSEEAATFNELITAESIVIINSQQNVSVNGIDTSSMGSDISLQAGNGFSTVMGLERIPNGVLILGTGPITAGTGTIRLSDNMGTGRSQLLSVATITAQGNVTLTGDTLLVGPNEVFTVFGDLSIDMATGASIGPTIATGTIDFGATPTVDIYRTLPGQIYSSFGVLYNDLQTSILSATALPVIPSPTYSGMGSAPIVEQVVYTPSEFQALLTFSGYLLNFDEATLPPPPSPSGSNVIEVIFDNQVSVSEMLTMRLPSWRDWVSFGDRIIDFIPWQRRLEEFRKRKAKAFYSSGENAANASLLPLAGSF